MVDLSVALGNLVLDNPIIPASGSFGYGKEFSDYYDINILGSFSFKGTTLKARFGNPPPRVAEIPSGILNSVGLQNPGIDTVIKNQLACMGQYFKKPVIANISGFSVEEFVECVEKLNSVKQVGILEINISCPNIHGVPFGICAKSAALVTREVKMVAKKPIFVKLSPNVTNIVEIAVACEEAGADGLTVINTLLGMRIDTKKRKPILGNKTGGISGPALFPVAVRMIYYVYEAVKIPIMGAGGVCDAAGAIEMMMAGATAVQVGAANFKNPYVCKEIIENLPKEAERLGITSLRGIVGAAH